MVQKCDEQPAASRIVLGVSVLHGKVDKQTAASRTEVNVFLFWGAESLQNASDEAFLP